MNLEEEDREDLEATAADCGAIEAKIMKELLLVQMDSSGSMPIPDCQCKHKYHQVSSVLWCCASRNITPKDFHLPVCLPSHLPGSPPVRSLYLFVCPLIFKLHLEWQLQV